MRHALQYISASRTRALSFISQDSDQSYPSEQGIASSCEDQDATTIEDDRSETTQNQYEDDNYSMNSPIPLTSDPNYNNRMNISYSPSTEPSMINLLSHYNLQQLLPQNQQQQLTSYHMIQQQLNQQQQAYFPSSSPSDIPSIITSEQVLQSDNNSSVSPITREICQRTSTRQKLVNSADSSLPSVVIHNFKHIRRSNRLSSTKSIAISTTQTKLPRLLRDPTIKKQRKNKQTGPIILVPLTSSSSTSPFWLSSPYYGIKRMYSPLCLLQNYQTFPLAEIETADTSFLPIRKKLNYKVSFEVSTLHSFAIIDIGLHLFASEKEYFFCNGLQVICNQLDEPDKPLYTSIPLFFTNKSQFDFEINDHVVLLRNRLTGSQSSMNIVPTKKPLINDNISAFIRIYNHSDELLFLEHNTSN